MSRTDKKHLKLGYKKYELPVLKKLIRKGENYKAFCSSFVLKSIRHKTSERGNKLAYKR